MSRKHRELAESLLDQIHLKSEHHDATWVQAWATVALVHSQIADAPNREGKHPEGRTGDVLYDALVSIGRAPSMLDPDVHPSSEVDDLPEVIIFQGAEAAKQYEVGRISPNEPFKLRDQISLVALLKANDGPYDGDQ